MECPKCHSKMERLAGVSFAASKCVGCKGIWFQDGSLELARGIKGCADAVDADGPNSAAAYNSVRAINCPECHKKMVAMVDRAQLHIQFEACSYCNGVFLDAGEFKDLAEFSWLERAQQAIEVLKSNLGR